MNSDVITILIFSSLIAAWCGFCAAKLHTEYKNRKLQEAAEEVRFRQRIIALEQKVNNS